jgi:hypothetical protein
MESASESPRSSPGPPTSCSSMARAALGLSVVAFVPPLGISAIVLGHMAKGRIAASGGLLNGKGLARAAWWIAYLQLALVSLVAVVFWGLFGSIAEGFQRDALVQRVLREHDEPQTLDQQSAREAESAAKMLVYQLIAIEDEIRQYSEEGRYSCQVNQLVTTGMKGMTEAERRGLEARIMESPYLFEISRCSLGTADPVKPGYVLTAVPRSPRMPEGSATFCADQTGVVLQLRSGTSVDCLKIGQPVQ